MDKPSTNIPTDLIYEKIEENSIKTVKVYRYVENNTPLISDDSIIAENKTFFYFNTYKYNKKGQLLQVNQMYES